MIQLGLELYSAGPAFSSLVFCDVYWSRAATPDKEFFVMHVSTLLVSLVLHTRHVDLMQQCQHRIVLHVGVAFLPLRKSIVLYDVTCVANTSSSEM